MRGKVHVVRQAETDKWLFGVTLALCLLGAVMIYSASAVTAKEQYGHSYYFVLRQTVWLLAGLVGMFALMRIDYHKLREPAVVMSLVPKVPWLSGPQKAWATPSRPIR